RWVIPAFISFGSFDHTQKWRFKAKRSKRQTGREHQSVLIELQTQEFSRCVQRASMSMHVEHGKIRPAEWLAARGFTGMFAQCRIQNVRAAPGPVPDLRIYFRVAGERIFLPLVPCHGAVHT